MSISECRTVTDALDRELTRHGTALFPVAVYHDDLAKTDVPWHWHDEIEALTVTEGSAVFETEYGRVELKAGEGLFINAGVLHGGHMRDKAPCRLHSIVFHPDLVGGGDGSVFSEKYIKPLIDGSGPAFMKLEADGKAAEYTELAWKSIAEEKEGFEIEARYALSRLLLSVKTDAAKSDNGRGGTGAERNAVRMKAMLGYIREHLSEEIRVKEVARAAAVSESECIRCFRSTTGATPIKYAKELRLIKAAELLEETDMSISEIGEKCGFREMSYFSRAFRERYGQTPGAYRLARAKRVIQRETECIRSIHQ